MAKLYEKIVQIVLKWQVAHISDVTVTLELFCMDHLPTLPICQDQTVAMLVHMTVLEYQYRAKSQPNALERRWDIYLSNKIKNCENYVK